MDKLVLFLFLMVQSVSWALPSVQANSKSPLFSDKQTLDIKLEAPYELLWQLIASVSYDPLQIKKIFVPGKLSYRNAMGKNVELKLFLRARGNTSQNRDSECTFPKLKLKFENVKDTIFDSSKVVNLATHCGELQEGELTSIGRAAHQEGTKREAFFYDILDRIGFITPKTRLVRVTYVDTDTAEEKTRYSFFLEDFDSLADRMDAKLLDAKSKKERMIMLRNPSVAKGIAQMDSVDLTRFYVTEAMGLNQDWILGDEYRWNVEILQKKDGTEIPVAYDFDLAAFATSPLPVPQNSQEIDPTYFDETNSQIDSLKEIFPAPAFQSVRESFQSKYADLLKLSQDSELNAFSKRHVSGFLKNINKSYEE